MANVTTLFVRLTATTASSGGGGTKMLSPGVLNTDWNGSLTIGANILNVGDVIRTHAQGTFSNSGMAANNMGLAYFFNPTGSITGTPIASASGLNLQVTSSIEWHFYADFTVTVTGLNGRIWCDGYVENVILGGTPTFSSMMGLGSYALDTTSANSLDLSAQVGAGNASFTLRQCAIERLPSP